MDHITISAVLIVKNESAVLDQCLQSVKGVDEIIVVDTGSEDNTVEIAKKYTDKVYTDFTWCDNFAKARNHAKSKATSSWILSIDADEHLHDFSKVQEAVKLAEEREILAVDVSLLAEDNQQLHMFPRLFKNDPRVWWEGAIHNHVSVTGQGVGDVKITYGYSPAHFKDPDRALRILENEVKTRADAVREMFYLGREYWYRGMLDQCLITLGNYVQRSRYLAEKADAFLIMSRVYWRLGMGDDARDACAQALIINPNFKEAVLFMATLAGDGSGNTIWEANALQWKRMAATANDVGVLFKRA